MTAAAPRTPSSAEAPGCDDTVLQRIIAARILAPVTISLLLVAILVGGIQLAGHEIPLGIQLIPFAISIVVFGLPHGALDHLVPARLNPPMTTTRSVVTVTALYAAVGGATAVVWSFAPLAGFTVFIALTWFHWGQGDLYIATLLSRAAPGRVSAAVQLAFRGSLPMLVPLIAHPVAYAQVISQTVETISPSSALAAGVLSSPGLRIAAGLVVAGLAVAEISVLAHSQRPLVRPLAEAAVLIVLLAMVPPVLAVGLYFTLWHSVRHIIRLELTDSTSAAALRQGRLLPPLLRFFRQAWPITLIAIVLLVAVGIWFRSATLGTYLILIAVLTTPHAILVTWMDVRQRSW